MLPLLLLAGVGALLFMRGGSAAPSGPSHAATSQAIVNALATETRPAALLSFAASIAADFPAEALALRKKAGH